VYYKQDGDHFLVISLYVDDMLLFGNSKDVFFYLESQLSAQFDKDLGSTKYIFGMEIMRDRAHKKIWLSQSM
jgi:hypothetical protein